MMELGVAGIIFLVVSCAASFLLARWLSKRRRDSQRERERRDEEAAQSRQVRRARERRRASRNR